MSTEGVKPKRLTGSCDFCRKRKIRCDSATQQNNECTQCRINGQTCTHNTTPKKRGVSNYSRQVTTLQQRVRDLEEALEKERSKSSFTDSVDSSALSAADSPFDSPGTSPDVDDLVESMERASLHQAGRYFGPSSSVYFMAKALESTPGLDIGNTDLDPDQMWRMHPWEYVRYPSLVFPEPDLLASLVDIYFKYPAMYSLPVIHEASFRGDLAAGLHLVDMSFGSVVLAACAIASRFTDDRRCRIEDDNQHSAGWKYFIQTLQVPCRLRPTVHDVQYCCLHTMYAMGTSAPQTNWTMCGVGMRYALELGMHRKHQGPLTVEAETRKRVFWTLLCVDRHVSLQFGRPFAINDEDFDLDLPVACDDEFFENDFQQPPDKPARIAGFIHHLRIVHIISLIAKQINGLKKSRKQADTDPSTIDSLLNAWFNAIPDHLRWDPQSQHGSVHYYDSAMLYIVFYDTQLSHHRQFLHGKNAHLLPSMSICLNAARSLSRLMETLHSRHNIPFFVIDMTGFNAGIMLVTNIRKRRYMKCTPSNALDHDVEDLWRLIGILERDAAYFHLSGRLAQSLKGLVNIPLHQHGHPTACPLLVAPSGYVNQSGMSPPDWSKVDPTLFGLEPPLELPWGTALPEMILMEEEDTQKWADAGLFEPQWLRDLGSHSSGSYMPDFF